MEADSHHDDSGLAQRPCPYCDGMVSVNARKCRHCGEWLADTPKPDSSSPTRDARSHDVEVVRREPPLDLRSDPPAPQRPPRPPGSAQQVNVGPSPVNPVQHVHVSGQSQPTAPSAQTVNIHVTSPAPPPHYTNVGYQYQKPPESSTFAVLTLVALILLWPVGFIMNLIGLFTGPKRGCFVTMLLLQLAGSVIGGIIALIIWLIAANADQFQ